MTGTRLSPLLAQATLEVFVIERIEHDRLKSTPGVVGYFYLQPVGVVFRRESGTTVIGIDGEPANQELRDCALALLPETRQSRAPS